jgi:hypothetical protein
VSWELESDSRGDYDLGSGLGFVTMRTGIREGNSGTAVTLRMKYLELGSWDSEKLEVQQTARELIGMPCIFVVARGEKALPLGRENYVH